MRPQKAPFPPTRSQCRGPRRLRMFAFVLEWARNARRDMGWISRIETGRQSWRPLRGWPRPRLSSRRWLMRGLIAAAALLGLNAPAARANVLIAIDKSTQQMSVSVD